MPARLPAGGGHHLVHAVVVAQVNHLRAHVLQDAAHDVDGGVVPFRTGSRRDKAHLFRAVIGQGFVAGGGGGTIPGGRGLQRGF